MVAERRHDPSGAYRFGEGWGGRWRPPGPGVPGAPRHAGIFDRDHSCYYTMRTHHRRQCARRQRARRHDSPCGYGPVSVQNPWEVLESLSHQATFTGRRSASQTLDPTRPRRLPRRERMTSHPPFTDPLATGDSPIGPSSPTIHEGEGKSTAGRRGNGAGCGAIGRLIVSLSTVLDSAVAGRRPSRQPSPCRW